MKNLIAAALLLGSTLSFAQVTEREVRSNPIVSGALKGIKKQYKMKCGEVRDLKRDDQMFTATVLCSHTRVINGESFESGVILEIEGSGYDKNVYIHNLKFTFAG